MMEISSAAPYSSTWKLNNPRVISKPPILVEVGPVKHDTGSMMAVVGVSTTIMRVESMMVGEAMPMTAGEVMSMDGSVVSMSMAGDVVSMSMSMAGDVVSMSMAGNAESTAVAGDEPSTLVDADELVEAVDAGRSVVVGEGAGESIDPSRRPHGQRQLTRFNPGNAHA
jgi:hypothetical protein